MGSGRGEDRGTGRDSHIHSSPLGMLVTGVRRTRQPAVRVSPLEDNDAVVMTRATQAFVDEYSALENSFPTSTVPSLHPRGTLCWAW